MSRRVLNSKAVQVGRALGMASEEVHEQFSSAEVRQANGCRLAPREHDHIQYDWSNFLHLAIPADTFEGRPMRTQAFYRTSSPCLCTRTSRGECDQRKFARRDQSTRKLRLSPQETLSRPAGWFTKVPGGTAQLGHGHYSAGPTVLLQVQKGQEGGMPREGANNAQ
jgi:hypothetical protein